MNHHVKNNAVLLVSSNNFTIFLLTKMSPATIKSTRNLRIIPLILALSAAALSEVDGLGVNWGTAASHPLQPRKVVELLKANGIAKVKLFDADPQVLQSLSGSGIWVTVGIPNSMLRGLNSSLKAAESWVHDNLTRFVSDGASRAKVNICSVYYSYVAVGDEPFLQTYGEQFYPFLVGAATNIQTALIKANLATRVKVVAPCSYDAFLSESNLPSKSQFRPDINRTMTQLLTFLNRHESPFFASMSPFQSYRENKNFTLDFALFRNTHKNIFDLSLDIISAALSNAGFPQMEIVVGQIGWPTDGAPNATSSNAEEFMNGLTGHLRNTQPGKSSKRQVSSPTEVYILSLLDEDERSIASGDFERHLGLFTFDGQAKYRADLGQGPKPLVNAVDVRYLSARWCVVDNNKDLSNATSLAREACAEGADCTALSPGSSCSGLGWPGNISYAFNSFYQQHDQNLESCDFGGLGLVTTVDPSVGSCRFFVGLSMSFAGPHGPGPFSWMVLLVTTISLWVLVERW
ncbi:glucan endo-1 3-beta-glucosidas [Striga asiatica]|uniref:Glucan endo-1 3-beta-glucosidas n=1 Tax=Striga asiatica TaxID=4170 RepID=A0A5A7NYW0_STRAF|nr:glucan endo-1 3-beta-glucosidas [Striga asiatica]